MRIPHEKLSEIVRNRGLLDSGEVNSTDISLICARAVASPVLRLTLDLQEAYTRIGKLEEKLAHTERELVRAERAQLDLERRQGT